MVTETPTDLVVVALPNENSPMQTVGSEEKHATLLYLGKNVDPSVFELIRASVEGCVRDRALSPFTETVSTVASLGDDGARVWMIDSDNGLRVVRDRLLRVPAIRSLYDTIEQHPNFTPHVTIGYPAEGQTMLSGIVESLAATVDKLHFDRIAIWYGDNHDCVYKLSYQEQNEAAAHSVSLIDRVLSHAKTNTVQDIYDDMTDEQRDVTDLIIGAAVEDVEMDLDPTAIQIYTDMTPLQKDFIDFVVGAATSEAFELEDDEDALEHAGVKGMKWGVRKGEITGRQKGSDKIVSKGSRKELRAKVKAGEGTLGEAHLAALKSKGHRTVNALLGDKTYWKRVAVLTGTATALAGIALAAPAVLPAGAVAAIGINSGAFAGAMTALNAAGSVNQIDNFVRAVTGNTRINSSYRKLGDYAKQSQTSGNARVQRLLRTNGIPRKVLHQEPIDDFLEHVGIKGMKWGVRRADGPDGTVSSNPDVKKTMASVDAARAASSAKAIKKHGVKALSDEDLNHLQKRLNLEKKLADVDATLLGKTNRRAIRYLGYGATMASVLAFANSDAGREISQLLRNSTSGRHAAPSVRGTRKLNEVAANAALAKLTKK